MLRSASLKTQLLPQIVNGAIWYAVPWAWGSTWVCRRLFLTSRVPNWAARRQPRLKYMMQNPRSIFAQKSLFPVHFEADVTSSQATGSSAIALIQLSLLSTETDHQRFARTWRSCVIERASVVRAHDPFGILRVHDFISVFLR